jgi:asparagine synthase (glutamine-hydrolysing)
MCGIAGLIEAPDNVVDEDALVAMAQSLAHRGPDAQGIWRRGNVGFAHRRLSILDLAGGVQPMLDPEERAVVVFNGQIYNHMALRRELQSQGARFKTDHSDTEVLVHGALHWRGDMCARLSGMFAFATVNLDRREMILARDPMGKKPLYIATSAFFDDGKPRLAFASELVALEKLPHARRAVDVRAVARYLAFDFVPDPDCIYDGVIKLPPGCQMIVSLDDPSSFKISTYRDLSFSRARPAADHESRVIQLRRAISDAVDARMTHTDVPIGIFLSGGIDSSLIAALAAQRSSRVETFSVAFREPTYDESTWARMVASHIKSSHHEELLDENRLLDVLPHLSKHLSEPFADHSVIPTYVLSRFARQQVTVALGGDGGDELFFGYPTFLAEMMRPRWLDRAGHKLDPVVVAAMRAAERLPVRHTDFALDFKIKRTLDGLAEPHPLRRHQLFLTGATDARLRRLFNPDVKLGAEDLLSPLDELEQRARAAGARDVYDILQYGYLRTFLAAGVLQKVDRASMACSLEVRAPLLDNNVVDLALALPKDEKLKRLKTKVILKDVARGVVPDAILDRKKKGFGMPVASWLCGPLRPMVDALLSKRALAGDALLNGEVIGKLVDEHLAKKANHRKILWSLLMLQLWRKR